MTGGYSFKNYFVIIFIAYLCVYACMYILFPNMIPAGWIVQMQMIFSVYAIFSFALYNKINIASILVLVFCGHMILSAILRSYFEVEMGNPFGINPVDSYNYNQEAKETAQVSFLQTGQFIEDNMGFGMDDWGMAFISRLCYVIFDKQESALVCLSFFNTIAVTLSVLGIYKLGRFFFSREYAKYVMTLWAIFPFSVYLSVNFLKENFFVLFIIYSFYYMYKFFYTKSIVSLLLMSLFISSTLFFRNIIFVMLILSVIVMLMMKTGMRNNIRIILVFSAIIGVISLNLFLKYISGFGLDFFYEVATYRGGDSVGAGSMYALSSVMSFFGPLPRIIGIPLRNEYLFGMINFFKIAISLFYVYGLYRIVKKDVKEYYPMICFLLSGVAMLIISNTSFDIRYQYTHLPFVYIISMYGFYNWKNVKYRWLINTCYLFLMGAMTYFYNLTDVA